MRCLRGTWYSPSEVSYLPGTLGCCRLRWLWRVSAPKWEAKHVLDAVKGKEHSLWSHNLALPSATLYKSFTHSIEVRPATSTAEP